uniref:Replication protein E1 n=1 Tax=Mouse papillomavirus 1 TaxID=2171376 RepID=A0A2S0SZ28_9PAPI|nr:E1 [Mouse papillomavirus 1]
MENDKGTGQYSGWCFIDNEAECVDDVGSLDNLEALFEQSTQGSFIDNDEVDQGNSLALLSEQLFATDEQQIAALKRKYAATPKKKTVEIENLSPRLESVSISPKGKSRRRLFDSGIGHETQDTPSGSEVPMSISGSSSANSSIGSQCESEQVNSNTLISSEDLLRTSNRLAGCYARFKEAFGCSFTDLTRSFKSDKTCSPNWVVAVFGAREHLLQALHDVWKNTYEYCQDTTSYAGNRKVNLLLMELKVGRSRLTLRRQLSAMLGVDELLILADPPNERSTLAALYFYNKVLFKSPSTVFYGSTPLWIASKTLLEHASATAESFDFSSMVQWAYDNRLNEEAEIAYKYALEADSNKNAQAWLKTTNQVKHVRDCCAMVRLYNRQEMKEMTMAQWIRKCCDETEEEGDWKVIANFLRYQEVNLILLLTALRHMFKGTPKKHCLVITGPPDTGKSYFCNSLNGFLKGRVISFMNSRSQFWLQPLADAKMGFLDDATTACWNFMDVYMRNALDGNPMQLDIKHRAPLQLKLPPLLITSNVDVMNNDNFRYLHSRLQAFEFHKPMPLTANGQPVYPLTKANWKSFFTRLANQLGIEEEEGENEQPGNTFRCSARPDTEPLRERQ